MSRRTDRVNELLREEISQLLQRSVKDPRISEGLVSITEVVVSPDLRRATVYVSYFGEESARAGVMQGLEHAAPFLHQELVRRLTMRNIPQLVFKLDSSLERGARLTSLIADATRDLPPEEPAAADDD